MILTIEEEKEVQAYILKELKIKYHINSVIKLLHDLDFSYKKSLQSYRRVVQNATNYFQ